VVPVIDGLSFAVLAFGLIAIGFLALESPR
jgi:hypothetical protein